MIARSADTGAGDDDSSQTLRWPVDRLLIGAAVLPFVASAVALVVGVGSSYLPVADAALAEMLVRDVGRHPVLIGLYSRADWSHPGPLLYYLLAPFYWITGGSAIGLNLGALAINGSSVVGMGLIARRRAGTAAMGATFLGTALLMRTLGAEFFHDSWNNFVTVMPFGLLIFLAWTMLCGDRWALPVGVFVATFLAQAHVGFVALALPLLAVGVIGLTLSVLRDETSGGWRSLLRPGLVSAGMGLVLWLPTLIDTAIGSPRNLVNIARWFRDPDEGVHSVSDGLRVMSGQFGIWPEWMTRARPQAISGQSPYLGSPVTPWLLLVVAVAAVAVWRRQPAGRGLVVVSVTAFGLGVVAVSRTVGPAFQYRLGWTYIPPVIAFVIVAMAGWGWVSSRAGATLRRSVAAVAGAALLVVTGVNVISSAQAGVPLEAETTVMSALTPQVLDALGDIDGPVLVSDPYFLGTWYARGLVLQLEKAGIRALVPAERTYSAAEHRVYRGEPLAARLVVVGDEAVAASLGRRDWTLIAEWSAVSDERVAAFEREAAELRDELESGQISQREYSIETFERRRRFRSPAWAMRYRVGVFLEAPPPDG